MIFSYLSLLNSIAAPFQFYFFEGATVTLRNISWYIFFALVNVCMTLLLHVLHYLEYIISEEEKEEDAAYNNKGNQGNVKDKLVLDV